MSVLLVEGSFLPAVAVAAGGGEGCDDEFLAFEAVVERFLLLRLGLYGCGGGSGCGMWYLVVTRAYSVHSGGH